MILFLTFLCFGLHVNNHLGMRASSGIPGYGETRWGDATGGDGRIDSAADIRAAVATMSFSSEEEKEVRKWEKEKGGKEKGRDENTTPSCRSFDSHHDRVHHVVFCKRPVTDRSRSNIMYIFVAFRICEDATASANVDVNKCAFPLPPSLSRSLPPGIYSRTGGSEGDDCISITTAETAVTALQVVGLSELCRGVCGAAAVCSVG